MLPITNEHGYYEIRLESIGGLGANVSAKILGELGALYCGLSCSSFSSYGSEKTGSPVKGFIRYAAPHTEIRLNSPIERPHILGLFHERMAGKQLVMAGVTEQTTVVVNTAESIEQTRNNLRMAAGFLICIDALSIAMENKTRVNMVMLGAIAKASEFLPLKQLEEVIKDTLGRKYPAALEGNLAGIRQGWDRSQKAHILNDGRYPMLEYKEVQQEWGYANAPLGGVTYSTGSTVSNDLTAGRQGYIPVFSKGSCINCGLCDTTCPDMVYQFVPGEYKGQKAMVNLGPDYHHCKGCLRCVEICPTDAITEGMERSHDISKTHVRNVDLIVEHMGFEDVGTNSWMESESATVNEIY